MQRLSLWGNKISDITPIADLVDLEQLWLDGNHISDIAALSGLVQLRLLGLGDNRIEDLSPLISNEGLGDGDKITLAGNPLDLTLDSSAMTAIDTLRARGAEIE